MIFNIRTPLFHYWEKYGYPKDTWFLGLNKADIDKAAIKDEKVKVKYWKHKDIFTVKAKTVQKYPVERLKGGDMELYIIPTTILGKSKVASAWERYNQASEQEKFKMIN